MKGIHMSQNDTIKEYERFVNQVAADTEILKIVVSTLIVRIAQNRRAEIIEDLHEVAKLAIEQDPPKESDGQLAQRLHKLKIAQTEEYFRKLREIAALSRPDAGSSLN
jgi:hypothetical protein